MKGTSKILSEDSPLFFKRKRVYFRPLNNENLISVIGHPDVLHLSYELGKSKEGMMTPGISNETLDGMSLS